MKKLILLITAVLLAFSSCSLNMEDSVLDGIEDSLPAITYYSEGLVYYTQASSTLREAPSQPVRDGFVFSGWSYSEDGEPITEWGSLLTESVTLYAVWELDASSSYVFVSENGNASGDGSQSAPYASVKDAIAASQGEEVKIFIDGCIKEDISIPAGKSVTIASLSSPVSFDGNGRAVINSESTEHGVISGQVTVESGASLTLRNVEIEPDSSAAILASDGNFSLTLDHVAITTMSGGRAVAVGDSTAAVTGSGSSPTAELSGDIELTVEASAFVLSGSNSRGISVAEARAIESAGNSLTLTVSDTRIIQADSDSDDSSICPIDIVGIDKAEISIDNTFISLKKNHYAVRFDNIGNEETVSNIVITDSEFNAWAAVFFRACSQNIDVEIRDSILKGTNYNSGDTNDFSTIAVNSTRNVNVDVIGSEIGFAQYGNANQKAASIYYWDNPFIEDGGNSINFYQCTFSMDGSGMLASAENYTGYVEAESTRTDYSPLPEENVITFDQASLNSITARGYIEISEEDLAYEMYVFPTTSFDGNMYYGTATCYNFAIENGADLGFARGAGTQEHPYIIENEAQFARINDLSDEMLNSTDNYFYFSIENDLNFSQAGVNPYIYVFRGELDFNGHTLSGVSFDYLSEQQDALTYSIIYNLVDGAIRNLVYKPDSVLNLVCCAAGSSNIPDEGAEIVIENVTAGSQDESRTVSAGTNDGLFVIHVLDNNATVTFRNCRNYYNVDCSAYTGIFLSGYAYPSVDLVFENCDNYGTFYGTSLGYLIGNSAHLAKSVTASGCDNYGALYASTDADFVCWGNNVNNVYEGRYNGENNTEGTIRVLDRVNANVSTNPSTAVISITSGLDRYSSFEIIASGYGDLYVLGTDEEVGTLLVSVSTGRIPVSEASSLSFRQLDFIDSFYTDNADITDDAYRNRIASVNGVSYYSIPLSQMNQSPDMGVRFPDDGILTSVRYRLYVYDADGNLAGTQELADS